MRRAAEGMSRQLALDMFATLIGPIRGGEAANAKELGTASGTPAVLAIQRFWPQLSAAQRATVDEIVYGVSKRPSIVPTAYSADTAIAGPTRQEFKEYVEGVRADFSAQFSVKIPDFDVVVSAKPYKAKLGTSRASASPAVFRSGRWVPERSNQANGCIITLYPSGAKDWAPLRPGPVRTAAPPPFTATVAHELFHCHQYAAAGGERIGTQTGTWIVEGSANWAGWRYAVGAERIATTKWWAVYYYGFDKLYDEELGIINIPSVIRRADREPSLFARSYDAIGFFAHIENSGGDPWATIDRMLLASSQQAFKIAAESGGGDQFLARWAMGLVGDPSLGPLWRTTGPALPDLAPVPIEDLPLQSGGRVGVINGGEDGNGNFGPLVRRQRVSVASGVQVIQATLQGYGALRWSPGGQDRYEKITSVEPVEKWYCLTTKACADAARTCPDTTVTPQLGVKTIALAVTGGLLDDITVNLEAHDVAGMCETEKAGKPPLVVPGKRDKSGKGKGDGKHRPVWNPTAWRCDNWTDPTPTALATVGTLGTLAVSYPTELPGPGTEAELAARDEFGHPTKVTVTVYDPAGATARASVTTRGDQWHRMRYPGDFPGATPTQRGIYTFIWEDDAGNPPRCNGMVVK